MAGLLAFLVIFVGAPLTELYLLIEVGSRIGALPTVALCLLTAALGGVLVRWQGIGVMMRLRETMARREVPAIEMLEGAAVLVAGVLLMLPGFVSDTLGLLLLIPPLRRAAILFLLRRKGGPRVRADIHVYTRDRHSGRIIEVDHTTDE